MQLNEDMQAQAKALADPSRFQMFNFIVEAAEPVGVPELTELLGFNHNAIRQHLAILVDAGLVTESTEQRKVRGRPRKLYASRNDALSAFRSVGGSYERLAELLLEAVVTGEEPFQVGYASAVEGGESVASLLAELAVAGFEPVETADDQITLHHCPFADVAAKNPGVVCELHRGLIAGHLERLGTGSVAGLEIRDPHAAGCVVSLTTKSASTTS